MVDIKNFKWEVVDDKNVKVNYYEKLLPIKTDDEGNEFFIVPNPYANYDDERSKFKRFLMANYSNRDDIAFKVVEDGYADTVCADRSSLFVSFDGIDVHLKPILYINREIGKKKHEINFEKDFKKKLKRFYWAIEFSLNSDSSNGFSHVLRDKDFDIVKFKTKKEAKEFIEKAREEVKKNYKKFLNAFDEKSGQIVSYNIICSLSNEKNYLADLQIDMLNEFEEENAHLIINYICLPEFVDL